MANARWRFHVRKETSPFRSEWVSTTAVDVWQTPSVTDHRQASKREYYLGQLQRQIRWARREGVRRVVREADPDLARRGRIAFAKWRFRRTHTIAPSAMPLFLIGAQRSGTTMLLRALGSSKEVEVHNESDSRVFERFRLRSLDTVREIVESSQHRVVAFKPLCDSHRVVELLEDVGSCTRGRAVWMFRSPAGRVRSTVGKFGPRELLVLRAIAVGEAGLGWEAEGLSSEGLDLIRSFDLNTMTDMSAAALFWYVRNRLVFELGLDARPDVTVVHYDALVERPAESLRALCGFVGIEYNPWLHDRIVPRQSSVSEMPSAVDERIVTLCNDLEVELSGLARSALSNPQGAS